ncbi:Extracellular solute-binding protein [Stieleria varia]|uniref:Extracellular solute-binding protein n=2 Tax=Stieleria varia TaxID=2528005 RepID=A0A5C6B578_9BACT|nr:Extracellular solute-binding protein [Stieleria varia]
MSRASGTRVFILWLLVVLACVCGFGFSVAVGQNPTPKRPPLVTIHPKTKEITVTVYDIILLADRTELYANPIWSDQDRRPSNYRIRDQIIYTPYDRKEGGIGFSTDRIHSITYWESLAEVEALGRMRSGDYRVADAIVKKMEQFNSDWSTVDQLRARIETRRSIYKIQSQQKVAEGLAELEKLHARFSKDPFIEDAFTDVLIQLATDALDSEDADQADGYLAKGETLFPDNKKLLETRRQWQAEAVRLVAAAEQSQLTNSGQAIAKAQRAVRLTNDPDLRRRGRIVIRNAEGLILASYEDPGVFEPINATRPVERQIVHLMHDFLMTRDETGTRYGRTPLVSRIQPRNLDQQYIVDLTPGLKFSNGSPITAADVVETIELLRNPAGEAFDAEWARFITGASQTSPFTVKLDVNPHPRPDSLLYLPVLYRGAFGELPQRGDEASRSPAAVSGPYRLSTVDGSDVQLVANSQFRSPMQIGKIKFKRYVKRGTGHAVNDLLQERIHVISDPSPSQLAQIRNSRTRFETRRIEPNSVWVLAVNHGRALFGDKLNPSGPGAARDLRRAASLAIDRQGILDQYFNLGGRGQMSHAVVSGPFPRQSKAYDLTFPKPTQQVDAARSLVSRYQTQVSQRKLVLKFADHGDVVESAMAQVKRDLEAVGFEVDLQKRPNNAFLRELRNGSFDLAYYCIEHDNVLFNIANLFDAAPTALGEGGNFMNYNNQTLSQSFEDLRTSKVSDEIWAIQNKIHRFIGTEAVVIPLWQLDTFIAYTRRLVARTTEGEGALPLDGTHFFRDVEQWYLKPQTN